jgi:hypothetical protein
MAVLRWAGQFRVVHRSSATTISWRSGGWLVKLGKLRDYGRYLFATTLTTTKKRKPPIGCMGKHVE